MKLIGGAWSKGDLIALVGLIAAVLAVPGMPKLFHFDKEPSKTETIAKPLKLISKSQDVTSGQVNFGCDQTLHVVTPVVPFGKSPTAIVAVPGWANTDNVKTQNQTTENVLDPADHHLLGVKGIGDIWGRDSQSILGIKNCPGGGHGELTLHVTWTQEE